MMRTKPSIISASIFSGVLLFFFLHPARDPGRVAGATIFEKIALEDIRIPPFPGGGIPAYGLPSAPRQVTINNIPLSYTLETRDASLREILDFYSGLYGEKAIRLEGRGWGAVRIIGADKEIFAIKADPSDPALLLTLWMEKNSSLFHVIPGERDLPGRDPDNVPRYPGTKRLFSLEMKGPGSPAHLALYEGEGSSARIIDFYRSRMPLLGWQERSLPHQRDKGLSLFVSERAECLIRITSEEGTTLITLIRRDQ